LADKSGNGENLQVMVGQIRDDKMFTFLNRTRIRWVSLQLGWFEHAE